MRSFYHDVVDLQVLLNLLLYLVIYFLSLWYWYFLFMCLFMKVVNQNGALAIAEKVKKDFSLQLD